ncbi:membrane protein|nr:membrane protein [Candidatus Pantoea persica]
MAGASRQQGNDLLGCSISIARRSSSGWRWVLALSLAVNLGWQARGMAASDLLSSPWLLMLMLFDRLALLWLMVNARLRHCFLPQH